MPESPPISSKSGVGSDALEAYQAYLELGYRECGQHSQAHSVSLCGSPVGIHDWTYNCRVRLCKRCESTRRSCFLNSVTWPGPEYNFYFATCAFCRDALPHTDSVGALSRARSRGLRRRPVRRVLEGTLGAIEYSYKPGLPEPFLLHFHMLIASRYSLPAVRESAQMLQSGLNRDFTTDPKVIETESQRNRVAGYLNKIVRLGQFPPEAVPDLVRACYGRQIRYRTGCLHNHSKPPAGAHTSRSNVDSN